MLSDKNIYPSDENLKNLLDCEIFTIYKEIYKIATKEDLNLTSEWRFYGDGNSWLCKFTYIKKTIFWLSVWEKFVKLSFYFTEKTKFGVLNLQIDDEIKKRFSQVKPTGKLIPLILDINKKEQLSNLQEIIEYKKSLK